MKKRKTNQTLITTSPRKVGRGQFGRSYGVFKIVLSRERVKL